MDNSHTYSKKMFWILTITGIMASAVVGFCLYLGISWITENLSVKLDNDVVLNNLSLVVERVDVLSQYFYTMVLPLTAVTLLMLSWLLWLVLRTVLTSKTTTKKGAPDLKKTVGGKKDFIDRKLEQDRKRRLFLHTLSVLQREGRLLDFFQEDLKLYEDEQIGAAVRSIHEDCKKTIKKYLNPKPVIEIEEEEEITIEHGFDIDAINLTGNVSGEPPFKGIVKHRGWKAGKNEIPKLSDIQDASIIVPAEVEIQ